MAAQLYNTGAEKKVSGVGPIRKFTDFSTSMESMKHKDGKYQEYGNSLDDIKIANSLDCNAE
jgi:hypothetical protein